MRILLLGDYSNVHATLAQGLRQLGHEVTVASDGDGWKNYPRDVNLLRHGLGRWDTLRYLLKLKRAFRRFRGYDVVQLINPVFLSLKGERIQPYYDYLRRHNKAVFLGAFGMDYYYATACLDCTTFRYSDFNFGQQIRHSEDNDIWIADWVKGGKGELNRYIAADCDGIIAGLYEYYAAYEKHFSDKLVYIPFPINSCSGDAQQDCASEDAGQTDRSNTPSLLKKNTVSPSKKLRFFIGIQRARSAYKGTDIMLRALERVVCEYPEACEMVKVESVPFDEYCQLMQGSDVILDQLYSYTPAMNALEAMAQGLIVVGGGEPENYDILNETELRPIINVEPTEESVYLALKNMVNNCQDVPRLSAESRMYIRKHHDTLKVARRYVDFWKSRMP